MIVIAPLPCAKKRIRLKKLIDFKNKNNERVLFYGWDRDGNTLEISGPMYKSSFILSGGGFANRKARLMYVLWFFSVLKACLSINEDEVVWAMGFETAFPALIISKIKGFKVIFDDADRFVLLFNIPSAFKSIIRIFEIYTSRNVFKHIIPSKERYDYKSTKFVIIKNTPTKEDIEKSRKIIMSSDFLEFINMFGLIVYVNGWLVESRGLSVIHKVLSSSPRIGVVMAGKIGDEMAEIVSKLPNCLYVGELDQTEALAINNYVDFIFTYYDPLYPINIYAESNKWGDALFFNKPMLINNEVKTAKKLIKLNVAFACDYNDEKKLITFLNRCVSDVFLYESYKLNIDKIRKDYVSFDEYLKEIDRDISW